MPEKICTRCRIPRPLREFSAHPDHRDGRSSWCKACKRDHGAKVRAASRDEARAVARARYRAWVRLVALHPEEHGRILAEERAAEGLS